MDYQKIYNQLIQKRLTDSLSKKDCYCESHHIIPRSEGGSDDDDNKVNLTAREHYIAHLLLAKIYNDYKMWHAVNLMSRLNAKVKINSRLYEMVRINSARTHSEFMKGKPSHNKGKKMSEEQKHKISDATKKTMADPELRKYLSAIKKGKPSHNKGKKMSEEQKHKISATLKGNKLSEETKRKISIKRKGKNNPMFGKSSWPNDPQKYEMRRLKMIQSQKCLKWWNNGTKMTKSKECPGPEWQRGRIKKKNAGN